MKRLIFHIGLPKTGTTAIQSFLGSRTVLLRAGGVLYPVGPDQMPAGEGLGQPHHADMFPYFYAGGAHLKSTGIDWATLFDDFRADPALHTIFVSFETQSVSGHSMRRERFRAATGDSEAVFLVYLRHPLHWLNSLYIETATSLYPFHGEPEQFPHVRNYIASGFLGMLEPFTELGRLAVRSYEQLSDGDALLQDVKNLLGVEQIPLPPPSQQRVNVKSFGREEVHLLRELKRHQVSQAIFIDVRNALLGSEKAAAIPGNEWLLPRHTATLIQERLKVESKILSSRFGVCFEDEVLEEIPNEQLFPVEGVRRIVADLLPTVGQPAANALYECVKEF